MAYRKFRIVLSKGWTYMICSLSVAVLALVGCRSKKVAQQQQEPPMRLMSTRHAPTVWLKLSFCRVTPRRFRQ